MEKDQQVAVQQASRAVFGLALLDELLFAAISVLLVPVTGFGAYITADILVAGWDGFHPGVGFVYMGHSPFMTAGWTAFFLAVSVVAVVLAILRVLLHKI